MDEASSAAGWSGLDDPVARERLLSAYYQDFRRIARRVLSGERDRLVVQPTELAHEAAIRILSSENLSVRDQPHFMALAAGVMRRTLIDEVRRQKSAKRGGDILTQWDEQVPDAPAPFDLEDFDGSLDRLAAIAPDSARIVELRFYAGLSMDEIADALAISLSTVKRRWQSARAWLLVDLEIVA